GFDTKIQKTVREPLPTDATQFLWADRTRIGWNADAVVITVNMFQFPSAAPPGFDHVQLLVLNPTTGATSATVDLPGDKDADLAPATMHGAAAGDPLWLA